LGTRDDLRPKIRLVLNLNSSPFSAIEIPQRRGGIPARLPAGKTCRLANRGIRLFRVDSTKEFCK